MAKSFVELGVKDSGFNAKMKQVVQTFAHLGSAADNAKGAFSKLASGLADVAGAQNLFNNALKGNPYGLLAQTATMAFSKIIEKATEATDAERRAVEWAEQKAEREQNANEAIGRSTGELMAKYEMLRVTWAALSTDQEKNQWIKNNQSAFNSLNLAVNDVNSAENVFVKNSSQVVAALKARAEAEAYAEMYKESIKKNAMNKATGKYNPQLITDPYYRPTNMESRLAGFTAENKHENYEYTTRKVMGRDGKYHDYAEWTGKLSKLGLQRLNALRQMGASSLENADRMDADYWASMMAQAQANANLLGKGLFGSTKATGGGSKGLKEDKDDMVEIVGLINNAKEAVSDLQRQRNEANTVEEIDAIDKKLAVAVKYYNELVGKGKEVKQLATGMSGFNANTMNAWMQGRQSDLSKAEYGSADYKSIAGNIADMNTLKNLMEQQMKAGLNIDMSSFWEQVFDGNNIPDSTWQSMADTINEKFASLGIEPIKINFQTGEIERAGENTAKSWNKAAQAISLASSAVGAFEDPAAKIAATIGMAVANIAMAYAETLAKDKTNKSNIWYFIATAAAAMVSMATTISQIHSATGYAQGGIVEGNSYSGDNMMFGGDGLYGLNAGELVLTKAAQGNLASQLSGGAQNLRLDGVISGENIHIVHNRYLKRTGQGELVTWG